MNCGKTQQLHVTYPSRINIKKTTLSGDKIKLIKISNKEKIFFKKVGKRLVRYRVTKIWMTATSLNCWKKKSKPRILH